MAKQTISFKKLSSTGTMSASGLTKGCAYFVPKTGLIHIATSTTGYDTFGPTITIKETSGTELATIKMGDTTYSLKYVDSWRPITDSVESTNSNTSASATAVKTAYDKAVSAYNLANGKTSNTGTVTSVSVNGSNGLTGSGTVSTSGTITISGVDATTAAKGVVQLSSAVNSTSETLAATPKAVKTAYDTATSAYNLADSKTNNTGTVTNVAWSASNGLTGSGNFTTSGTVSISGVDATTTGKGVVQLSNAIDSTSTTLAATPNAVKTAYDKAVSAYNLANTKTSNTGTVTKISTGTGLTGGDITSSGTISINSTYQTYISNGNAAYSYFSNGVANNAARLSTTNKSIWGQTYWNSNGVPQDVTGAMSNVTNITMSGYIKMGDATISYDSAQKCVKFSF